MIMTMLVLAASTVAAGAAQFGAKTVLIEKADQLLILFDQAALLDQDIADPARHHK